MSRLQRSSLRIFAVLFLLLSLVVGSCFFNLWKSSPIPAQANATSLLKHSKKDRTCTSCSPRGNQEIYIPLIDLPESQKGELVFNSRSPESMTVTPVFYKRSGEAVIADPVQINSAEIRYADIKRLLPRRHQQERDWGGLSLIYYGTNREMWSQFRFMGVNGGGNVDEFFTVKDESRSALYDATWWMPDKSEVIIALGNISDSVASAVVRFGNGHTRTVELRPRASEIVREEYPSSGPESLHISVNSAAGSVIPTGLITKKNGSFNSAIRFYDPTKAKQSNLYGNGLRVRGTTPHMVLKNTTAGSIAILPQITPLGGNARALILAQVSLAANETKEVDLSELLDAAKHRNDLGVVSVEITNWASPGSLIGSLYNIDNRTHLNYEVPLRDSGPFRSMTGAYPWKIDGDYKSIAYVTNITDEPAEFVVELAYDGGRYSIGPRKLQAHETAVFDIARLTRDRVKDISGNSLPLDATHGQFKWAQRGATNGKILLVGRTEMVSIADNVSSSYSCPMDCGPSYEATVDFPSELTYGSPGSGSVTETATWNYGYTMGPYPASAQWSLDNQIANFDPGEASSTTITPTDLGTSLLTASAGTWERYDWDGLECVDVGPQPETGGGPMDVGGQDVSFQLAIVHDRQGSFVALNTASVALSGSSHHTGICSDHDNFTLRVNFVLPPGGTLVNTRCNADVPNTPTYNDYSFNAGNPSCVMDSGLTGHLTVPLTRTLGGNDPDNNPRVTIVVGASKNGSNADGHGAVNILCSQ